MKKKASTRRISIETTHPDVFLTINKNRLRIYNGNSIFLKHNDEFEVEFNNTTRFKWLAKIKLNGEWVSNAGLVLRPGEHVFLDTPNLDSRDKHRFQFETYSIESGRSHLVQDNGLVEIFFYKKQELPQWYAGSTFTTWNEYYPMYVDSGRPSRTSDVFCSHVSDGTINLNDMNSSIQCSNISVNASHPVEETGRIEQGSESNQDFQNVNDTFESYHSYTIEYRILPVSKKPKTINEIKEYCSNCGRRRKKNDIFCPACGQRF